MIVWIDGEFRAEGAHVSTSDRGLLLADGAFETVYLEGGRAAFLAQHIARLKAGLETLRIAAPPLLGEIDVILSALAAHNGLGDRPAAARITVTRGPGDRGLKFGGARRATMLASAAPLAPAPSAPLRLKVSARPRFAAGSAGRFKAIGGYVEHILAHNEAVAAGADEALMANEHGRLACAAAANVFLIVGEGLATPPVAEGALPGVVRGAILEDAAALGLSVEERPIELSELQGAPVFVTNSLIGVRAAQLAEQGAPASAQGSRIFSALQSWYQSRLARELKSEEARP